MNTHPYAAMVIRSVLAVYAVWGAVVVTDLFLCLRQPTAQSERQRSELRGAATAIPATLLAWLADSPITGNKP